MSIKIFNGYRIAAAADGRPDVFETTALLRAALEPIHKQVYARTLAVETVTLLDRNTVLTAETTARTRDGEPAEPGKRRSPIHVIANRIRTAHRELAAPGPSSILIGPDFRCEVAFLADSADAGDRSLYALFYADCDEYKQAWEAMSGVEEFNFWNHTDRLEHVSDDEWEQRRQTWDRLLDGKAPIERGLSWQLFGSHYPLRPDLVRDDLSAHLPDMDQRARTVARSRVPIGTFEEGSFVLRDRSKVRAEIDAEATRVRPLLSSMSVEDLFAFTDLDDNA